MPACLKIHTSFGSHDTFPINFRKIIWIRIMKCIDYNNFKLDHHATDDCVALSKLRLINFTVFLSYTQEIKRKSVFSNEKI